jgi:hypothetical protein
LIAVFWKWRIRAGVAALFLLGANLARADPFYLRYDATETFPEQDGWTRYGQDPEHLEKRSLEDGWLTLDGLESYSIMDYYTGGSPAFDLQPGEELRVAWRMQTLRTDLVSDYQTDPGVFVINGARQYADLYIGTDFVANGGYGWGEPDHRLWFNGGIPHTYLLTSADMQSFTLYVDGGIAFSGQFLFEAMIGPNCACFGDAATGLRSLSIWDFFEVQVVPEPGALALGSFTALSTLLAKRRTLRCYVSR